VAISGYVVAGAAISFGLAWLIAKVLRTP